MSAPDQTSRLKTEAARLGFALSGVCKAAAPPGIDRFREWISRGYAGEMTYLADRADAYADPGRVLDGVDSILMLGMPYSLQPALPAERGQGRVSRYAWSDVDYHDVIHDRLQELCGFLRREAPEAVCRGVVDTAPLLEREFAQLAGLGWIGKNSLLLSRDFGSYFFLAAVLTDLPLAADAPFPSNHCGACRACLDACPTNAFVEPYVLDASRCISYLTIELRGPIPHDLRPMMGDWIFGCDVCQEVCPWTSHATDHSAEAFAPSPDRNPIDANELLMLSETEFRARFRKTPLWRAKRRGVLRNAAIALGNRPCAEAIKPLACGLADDEPLVRGACAWALARQRDTLASTALQERLAVETDAVVRAEIQRALEHAQAGGEA
ncbi:MAG: tRNA epoxyqueuosine(34) reductase QueG [Planctomycetales bacterium]|nr:tRNA epoxyqueuosine(34) reductase QueG [Planctomycetales bacterium]